MLVLEALIEVLAEYIKGHIVYDYALYPASVYHEVTLAAVVLFGKGGIVHHIREPDTQINALSEVACLNPYSIGAIGSGLSRRRSDSQTLITPNSRIPLWHHRNALSPKQSHNTASGLSRVNRKLSRSESFRPACSSWIKHSPHKTPVCEGFRTKTIYERLFPRVVTYSDKYQGVQAINITHDGTEALASAKVPASRSHY